MNFPVRVTIGDELSSFVSIIFLRWPMKFMIFKSMMSNRDLRSTAVTSLLSFLLSFQRFRVSDVLHDWESFVGRHCLRRPNHWSFKIVDGSAETKQNSTDRISLGSSATDRSYSKPTTSTYFLSNSSLGKWSEFLSPRRSSIVWFRINICVSRSIGDSSPMRKSNET